MEVWDEQGGGTPAAKGGGILQSSFQALEVGISLSPRRSALPTSQDYLSGFCCRWVASAGWNPWRQDERVGEESLEGQLDFFLIR